ncbi:GRIN2-like protein [Dissostichus eleginoides]|uniref:GRIN2-like protein n=2 Tax=Nototheniidae TaxID=8206 RepID=A0AAD9CPJ6_DISEL|nr:GRIN2-like protein [Dissostichus eleginoides]
MAEAGGPVSELKPGGVAVALSGQPLCDPSRAWAQPAAACRPAAGTACPPPQELHQEHSGSDGFSLRVGGQEKSQCEHFVPYKAPSPPHSLAEKHTPQHPDKAVVTAAMPPPQAGGTVQGIEPPFLHRSHPDTTYRPFAPLPPLTDTCGLSHHGGGRSQASPSMLACKQPMQLQQCSVITTTCRGGSSGDTLPHSRCVCFSAPQATAWMVGVEEKLPPKCEQPLCCGSYVTFEDTFAAYCHPQPLPAQPQLLHRMAGGEPHSDIQQAGPPPSVTNHLTLPRLVSSVSDTGLDSKHLRCCSLGLSYSRLPAPPAPRHFGGEECCSHVRTTTRDMGTMTTHTQLRDVGVQTAPTATPHVFPEICLAEECRTQTNTDSDGGRKGGGTAKSPVKEVKWDAEGMTWEVYGASVDPEELGLAIQKHLELQIKETASHAAKLSRQNTSTSQQEGGGCQRKRSRMMGSIRAPACCTTAVD